MIIEGSQVKGKDIKGNLIEGIVSNILSTFQVAIVRTGTDRTHTTEAYIKDLKGVEE